MIKNESRIDSCEGVMIWAYVGQTMPLQDAGQTKGTRANQLAA